MNKAHHQTMSDFKCKEMTFDTNLYDRYESSESLDVLVTIKTIKTFDKLNQIH